MRTRFYLVVLMMIPGFGNLLLAGTTSANLDNVRFALHRKGPFVASKGASICGSYSPNAENLPCTDYTVEGPAPGGSTVYLVVGQGGLEGIAGFSCGIDYSGRRGLRTGIDPEFVTWTGCLDAEFPNYGEFGDWPNPKGGNRMVWDLSSNCQRQVIGSTGVHAVAGAFYVYAFSEDVLEITPNDNLMSGPELAVVDCNLEHVLLGPPSVICGKVHFGGDGSQGFTPCTMGPPTVGAVDAALEPSTLNTYSLGQWIKASLELPEPYSPSDLVVSTIRACGVPADSMFFEPGDFNGNGILDGAVRFSRSAMLQHFSTDVDSVEVSIRGRLTDSYSFTANPFLRLVRPRILTPRSGDVLMAGSHQIVEWERPPSWRVEQTEIWCSLDRGRTWALAGTSTIEDDFTWRVPEHPTETALMRVVMYDEFGFLGADTSDGVFSILLATGIRDPESSRLLDLGNSPNPFRLGTLIHFTLPQDGPASLVVIDIHGRLVRVLLEGRESGGVHEVYWDGRDDVGRILPDGLYYYRLRIANVDRTGRMLKLRT